MRIIRLSTLILIGIVLVALLFPTAADQPGKPLSDLLYVPEVTVNVAIICTKEFGDVFHYDRKQIEDYLTLVFWDVNARFKTLSKSNIAIHVTSLTLIYSFQEQPFIEKARSRSRNEVNAEVAAEYFSEWILTKGNLNTSTFDVAIAIHSGNSNYESFAIHHGICNFTQSEHMSVAVITWNPSGSMPLAISFALGLLLGASIVEKCPDSQHIMCTNTNPDKRQYFSGKDDNTFLDFILSKSNCLSRRKAWQTPTILDPDYDNVIVTRTLEEECQKWSNYEGARVHPDDVGKCTKVRCQLRKGDNAVVISPLDNTKCGANRRCFRGKCVNPGSLLVNIATRKCLRAESRFEEGGAAALTECPRIAYPTDRFTRVRRTLYLDSEWLTSYFIFQNLTTVAEKCLSVKNNQTEFQSAHSRFTALSWKAEELSTGDFLLKHESTEQCAKHENGTIVMSWVCSKEDANFRWKFYLVYPTNEMCGEDRICESNLRLGASYRMQHDLIGTQIILNATIHNLGEPAVFPALTISWNTSLSQAQLPHNCIHLGETENGLVSYKCKLGRLILTDETAQIILPDLHVRDDLVGLLLDDSEFGSNLRPHISVSAANKMITPDESATMRFVTDVNLQMESHSEGNVTWEKTSAVFQHIFQIALNCSISLPNVSAIFQLPWSVSLKDGSTLNIIQRQGNFESSKQNISRHATCHPSNFHMRLWHPDDSLNYEKNLVLNGPYMTKQQFQNVFKTPQSGNISEATLVNAETGQLEILCGKHSVTCLPVICHFNKFTPGLLVIIPFELEIPLLQIETLKMLYNVSGIKVESNGRMLLPEYADKKKSLVEAQNKRTTVSTIIQIPAQKSWLALPWMYIASVILALAILVIAIVSISRKRRKKQDRKNWVVRIKKICTNREPASATSASSADIRYKIDSENRYTAEPRWSVNDGDDLYEKLDDKMTQRAIKDGYVLEFAPHQ